MHAAERPKRAATQFASLCRRETRASTDELIARAASSIAFRLGILEGMDLADVVGSSRVRHMEFASDSELVDTLVFWR